jgi:hypothetical protein
MKYHAVYNNVNLPEGLKNFCEDIQNLFNHIS